MSANGPNRTTSAQAARKPGRNFKDVYFQRRRRPPTAAEQEQNRRMIEEFIAKRGVTVCPPGHAAGVVQTQYEMI